MMTPEQRAAFVMGQAALLNAKIAAMQAANAERERSGLAQAYSEKQFDDVITEFEAVLGYNAAISYFNSSY